MREIKFRFWDKKDRRWCGWDISGWVLITDNQKIQEVQIAPKYEHIVTMQYTGLKDKNGKEIYEGDIVKIGNMNWQILWDVRNAQFSPHTIDDIDTQTHISSGAWPMRNFNWLDCGESVNLRDLNKPMGKTVAVEVIGNIYENPELVTQKH